MLPALARIAIEHSPIAYGIALVENADKQLVVIEGVEPEAFAATDERLLKLAKSLAPRLPFEHIDALVVEWIGKEISGAGMDPAVVGRVGIRSVPDPEPAVRQQARRARRDRGFRRQRRRHRQRRLHHAQGRQRRST